MRAICMARPLALSSGDIVGSLVRIEDREFGDGELPDLLGQLMFLQRHRRPACGAERLFVPDLGLRSFQALHIDERRHGGPPV
nr:hypothetical protein CFP56_74449 [Quercus suber]